MADDVRDFGNSDYDPVLALTECHDLWASGAWPDENAAANLDEVMAHLEKLLFR